MKTHRHASLFAVIMGIQLTTFGAVITYHYDAAGRLTGVNYGGTSNTTYAYDKNGSLLSRLNTTSPLPPLAANYTGLIANTVPGIANTGVISLKMLPTGAFTGKLALAGKTFTFKGTFTAAGTTPGIVIARKAPLANLTLTLALDVTGGTNQITGAITDSAFTSQLTLDHAAYDKKLNPLPGGIAGAYTVLFRPTQATGPQGFGFGTAKVDAAGGIKLAATLPEGTKIAQGSTLSSAGTWALYLPLYKGGGLLAGAVTFATDPGASDFAGALDWLKPATPGPLYPAAFATELDFIGSKYTAPPKGQRVLDFAAGANNARITAGATGIATLDKLVTLDAANKLIIPADAAKLKLTITTPTGLFLGSYLDGTATRKFGGVIFQEQNLGGGFVTGPAATGPAILAEP